jgi:hypothetical protein
MAECLASIKICRLRVTRLLDSGAPKTGPNNSLVSDLIMQLGVTPVIAAGKDVDLIGGCDCIIASYRGNDKIKRFDFELDMGVIDDHLVEMLLGATAITSGGDVIGESWPVQQFSCGVSASPPVALEVWTENWNQDHLDSVNPYRHWVWPMTFWSIAPFTMQDDFLQPKYTAFSRGNSAWGNPYGDLAGAMGVLGGSQLTTVLPDPACGYLTAPLT